MSKSATSLKIKRNEEKEGIELYFDGKPDARIMEHLKNQGFRCATIYYWYAKENNESRTVAAQVKRALEMTVDRSANASASNIPTLRAKTPKRQAAAKPAVKLSPVPAVPVADLDELNDVAEEIATVRLPWE